jgi:hypothetical protein
MFDKLRELWDNNGFEILVGLSLALILIYGLYRIITKKKGTWSDKYYYNGQDIRQPFNENKKFLPKESKGEIECRRVLQKIFNRPFNKARPNFLNNPVTGGNFNLEIDCFDSELGIGVEYNGVQHYKYNKFFHKNYEHFLNQKYRDDMKRRICKDNGIILIEVPYTVKLENIEYFIKKELKKYNL